MKYLFSLLLLILTLNSCQPEQSDVIENILLNQTDLNKSNPQDLYPHLNLPNELVQKYISGEFDDKDYNDLLNWINDKTEKLEKECQKSNDCGEKMSLMDQLIYLQYQMDLLGLDGIALPTSLCNEFLNEENTGIFITPDFVELEIEKSITLSYEIVTGETNCDGEVRWESGNPTIATITQDGLLTGVSPGNTIVYANVKGTDHITGIIQVTVKDSTDKFEIVMIVETGSATSSLNGYYVVNKYFNGVKDVSTEIYNSLHQNFGDNFKFGLVGFEHYPVLPWGCDASFCREGGWSYPEFEPTISMSAFHQWLSFSNAKFEIEESIKGIRLMCSYKEFPSWNLSSPFSAVIKTIQNFEWSDNANKAILLIGQYPAGHRPEGYSGVEGYSGFTVNDVINLANGKNVKIFTMCFWGANTGSVSAAALKEYEEMADYTNGIFTTDLIPLETNIPNMISYIKDSYK